MSDAAYETVRANLAAFASPWWSQDRLRKLVDGHEAGKTFLTIARDLGGTTKNACIGQGRRLGLPARCRDAGYVKFAAARSAEIAKRRAAIKREVEPPRPPKPQPVTDPAIKEALALPGLAPVLISALSSDQCRWPVGDPKDPDFAFCGRLKGPEGSYCPAHGHAAVDARATARAMKTGPDKLERLAGPTRHRRAA